MQRKALEAGGEDAVRERGSQPQADSPRPSARFGRPHPAKLRPRSVHGGFLASS